MGAAKKLETLKYETVNKNELRRKWMNEKKRIWKDKRIYGEFLRGLSEIRDEKET